MYHVRISVHVLLEINQNIQPAVGISRTQIVPSNNKNITDRRFDRESINTVVETLKTMRAVMLVGASEARENFLEPTSNLGACTAKTIMSDMSPVLDQ